MRQENVMEPLYNWTEKLKARGWSRARARILGIHLTGIHFFFFFGPRHCAGILICMDANCLHWTDNQSDVRWGDTNNPNFAPLGQCGVWNEEETN